MTGTLILCPLNIIVVIIMCFMYSMNRMNFFFLATIVLVKLDSMSLIRRFRP